MSDVKNFLIVVNSGVDHPYNHYAAYVVAFLAKKLAGIENVSLYYGPEGVAVTRKGELAKLKIDSSVKELIAGQVEGLNACGTFHVIDGIGKDLDDLSNSEDFVVPLKLPDAAQALLGADKIHYL